MGKVVLGGPESIGCALLSIGLSPAQAALEIENTAIAASVNSRLGAMGFSMRCAELKSKHSTRT